VLELGKRFFERVQRMMINTMCQPDYENVVATGILAYLYPADYPGVEPLAPPRGMDGWDCVTWRGPSDLTVDRGRDGRMYLELIRSGLMSREEWWVKNNEDPEEMEAVATDELAARLNHWVNVQGLPEDKFWLREFGANGSLSVTDDANAEPGKIAAHSIDELAAAVAQLIKEKPDRL
jgi:capsid protein